MKKAYLTAPFLALLLPILCGCNTIGAKTSSVAIVYDATTVLSLLLLIGYCALINKKDTWFITLFASVFIVNAGYFSLSISTTLEEALLANRISYLGSAMLPLAMLMIIQNACNIRFNKYFTSALVVISITVFLIAASPGYLDIYYKSVTLGSINGATVLNKEYGSWHSVYLFYLLSYFGAMIFTIIISMIKRKLQTVSQAIIVAAAVFINIGVWLLEQLVKIDFEILSVSYIITELFLLALYIMIQETERVISNNNTEITETLVVDNNTVETISSDMNSLENTEDEQEMTPELLEKCAYFSKQLDTLTATEKNIYQLHIDKKSTKEIMAQLNIKENTLKYHNKNLYSKLGVTSRKELREIAELVTQNATV